MRSRQKILKNVGFKDFNRCLLFLWQTFYQAHLLKVAKYILTTMAPNNSTLNILKI